MILVFGKTGQVARELQRIAPDGTRFLGRDAADLADPPACAALIDRLRPSGVINAAAYTAVDKAETEEGTATVINGAAPGAMARSCASLGIPLVQISTDYVFDGSGSAPFSTDSATAPLNAYGRSKLAGEVAVRAAGGPHAILRTAWVFSAYGSNFLKTMLRLGASRAEISVVDDQIGGPTPAGSIAAACLTILDHLRRDPGLSGTCHFSGAPDVSWAGFARAIMSAAALPCAVRPIPSSEYPTPARRPANSRLDCSGLDRFGLGRPDWQAALPAILKELEQAP